MDRYTRCCLTAIAILLTVLVIGLWATGPVGPAPTSAAPPAAAEADTSGIGNPAAQRAATIQAINTTNQKLDRIISLIESGKIKVTVVQEKPDDAQPKVQAPAK
ncbi:MAG: hypothetical protein AMJ81_01605 [Phycisphaerae bacterium SM23_33]|nr:MAG: hypothetical protein AMJ81_01605 [Phycisphaerae bacterium SM23_33]